MKQPITIILDRQENPVASKGYTLFVNADRDSKLIQPVLLHTADVEGVDKFEVTLTPIAP